MNYESIRDALKTGDVVLFSGKGGVSEWIKWFTKSRWSHVGMVVRLTEWNMVLLWESTTLSNVKDVETGVAHQGVQLVGLRERLMGYGGEIAVRQLSAAPDAAQQQALGRLRSALANRPYEENKLQLIRAATDGLFGGNTREDLSSLFCSELVAEAYQAMGLLPEVLDEGTRRRRRGAAAVKPSNEYVPADFSTAARDPLPLLKNVSLGNEVPITL